MCQIIFFSQHFPLKSCIYNTLTSLNQFFEKTYTSIALPYIVYTSQNHHHNKHNKTYSHTNNIFPSSLLCVGFVGSGLGFASREYLVWYVLFIVFVPYAMLPLPLKWCVVAGSTSSICHLFVTSLARFLDPNVVSVECNK